VRPSPCIALSPRPPRLQIYSLQRTGGQGGELLANRRERRRRRGPSPIRAILSALNARAQTRPLVQDHLQSGPNHVEAPHATIGRASDPNRARRRRQQVRKEERSCRSSTACYAQQTAARWRSECSRVIPPTRARSPSRSTRSAPLRAQARGAGRQPREDHAGANSRMNERADRLAR